MINSSGEQGPDVGRDRGREDVWVPLGQVGPSPSETAALHPFAQAPHHFAVSFDS